LKAKKDGEWKNIRWAKSKGEGVQEEHHLLERTYVLFARPYHRNIVKSKIVKMQERVTQNKDSGNFICSLMTKYIIR
jgi:hypothetical protein